ncbi:hypothetical protein QSJ19_14980 [Gordonia sp. ABSL11-1]|uniref:hypothetical protein n=1 Tax=Gordonia sp. ABSL11-1 TaxID=3053924 RepID=UPI0025737EA2|nr:hypothetical protein [Gordonia sp. ABSL11-1]MDL9946870.1 hypothetical protein [Gordonia sp. ABSL11-1]
MTNLDDATDELYGVLPAEFVARRAAIVKRAKAVGDRDLAREVTALRRPTQGAWAINQWTRREPDGVSAVLDLGAEMVNAQRTSSADRLRELSARRQELVAESSAQVAAVAAELGSTLSANAIREVTQSLRAAVADSAVAEDLRRGRLVAAVEYSGFGPAGVFVVPDPQPFGDISGETTATPDGSGTTDDAGPPSGSQPSTDAEIAAARASLADAETAEQAARHAVEERDRELASARERAQVLSGEINELRAELARRETELRFAQRQAEVAASEQASAAEALARAHEGLEAARTRLDAVERP